MDFEEMTPEEMILEDIQEWCEVYLLDGESWGDYLAQFTPNESSERMSELLETYWQDHIFPIDKYA